MDIISLLSLSTCKPSKAFILTLTFIRRIQQSYTLLTLNSFHRAGIPLSSLNVLYKVHFCKTLVCPQFSLSINIHMRYCKEFTYETESEEIHFKAFAHVIEDATIEEDDIDFVGISDDFEISIIEAAPVFIGSEKKVFFSDLDEATQEDIREFIDSLSLEEVLNLPDYEFEVSHAI